VHPPLTEVDSDASSTRGSNQASLRHPPPTPYGCFLPDLTGFEEWRRAGPDLHSTSPGAAPDRPGRGREFSPAEADCGYRAPLAPRLARSRASIRSPADTAYAGNLRGARDVRMSMMRISTISLSLLLSLTACSSGTASPPPTTAPPDSPVSTVAPPAPPGPVEPSPAPLIPTAGLQNVHPIQWQDAIVGADDRSATLTWYTGPPECYGLDHVDTRYTPGTVRITLYEGTVPGAEVCTEIAMFVSTTVTFDEPVGGREIVDGAKEPDAAT